MFNYHHDIAHTLIIFTFIDIFRSNLFANTMHRQLTSRPKVAHKVNNSDDFISKLSTFSLRHLSREFMKCLLM